MTAEDRAEAWARWFSIYLLAKSANLQPRNETRVRVHQKAIEILLHDLQYSQIPQVHG